MKGALVGIGLGVVLLVLVVGGVLVYRSTAPNGDVVPEGEALLEERGSEAAGGQFIQLEPEAKPEAVLDTPAAAPTAGSGAAPDTEVAAEETATISMTDTGFSPAQITIAAGTTVEFVNNGQALHWPASAVHPTHDILPEFDSRRGIPTGGTYSYTFEQSGSWDFHDHLNPQFTGTVTVE